MSIVRKPKDPDAYCDEEGKIHEEEDRFAGLTLDDIQHAADTFKKLNKGEQKED